MELRRSRWIQDERQGIRRHAGTGGNSLLTKNQELKSCKLTIEIEATEETVAYLALRANKDGKGWHAVTSKIEAKAGKVRVGGQGVDFEERRRCHLWNSNSASPSLWFSTLMTTAKSLC